MQVFTTVKGYNIAKMIWDHFYKQQLVYNQLYEEFLWSDFHRLVKPGYNVMGKLPPPVGHPRVVQSGDVASATKLADCVVVACATR